MHPMLIAPLFAKASPGKKPKFLSTEEWIKKMCCIVTIEYYTAIKKNKIMPFTAKWMDLEIVIVSNARHRK